MTTPNNTARFTDSKSSPMHQLEQMKEWEVLIDLREATDYNEWTNNICGWDELEVHQDPSLCDGIESNENGAVVRVDLRSSGLQGHIPTSLSKLYSLEKLWLSNNRLSGSVPTTIASLDNLQHLDLKNNLLSGDLPIKPGSFKSLKMFAVEGNSFNDAPPQLLRQCPKLLNAWQQGLLLGCPAGLKLVPKLDQQTAVDAETNKADSCHCHAVSSTI